MPFGAWREPSGQQNARGRFALDVGEARAPRSHTVLHALFFALKPLAPAAYRLLGAGQQLLRRYGLTEPLRPAGQLHVSLLGLGGGRRLDQGAIDRGLSIGAAIRRPQFDIVFDRAMSFGRGHWRPLVLCCSAGTAAALEGLRDALGEAREELGLGGFPPPAFTPHLTLSYTARPIEEVELDDPIVWRARELLLLDSAQGAGRHAHLGRWTLHPQPGSIIL